VKQSYKELSGEDKEEIKKDQKGTCAICFRDNVELVIDHCHETGFVRKGLCRSCNTGLGFFQDDWDTLLRAACYVIVHKAGLDDIRIGYKLLFRDYQERLERQLKDMKRTAKEQVCRARKQLPPAGVGEFSVTAESVDPEISISKSSVP